MYTRAAMSHPAFTICICPDSCLLRKRLDVLIAAHPFGRDGPSVETPPRSTEGPAARQALPWQRLVFWADEGLSSSFWENLTLQGLFAVPKALILRNVNTLPADTLKRLSAVLAAMAAGRGDSLVWPLLCFEVGFEKGKAKIPVHISRLPFWQAAERHGWIDEIPKR